MASDFHPAIPPAGKPKLLDQVRHDIRVRHMALSTERLYVNWIRRFILFHHKRHPAEMGKAEVSAFLTHLAVDGKGRKRAEKGSELFVLAQFAINSSDPFCAPILGRAADLDPKTGGRGGLQDRWKRREVNRVKRSLHRASHTLVVVARLAIDLTEAVAAEAGVFAETEATNTAAEQVLSVEVPAGRTALRFRPLMRAGGHVTIPNDVDRYRYQIEVEQNGHRTVIWREDIPPFLALGGRQWWDDRLISTADFAAQKVTFHLTAAPRNGHSHPRLHVGFDHVALLTLAPLR